MMTEELLIKIRLFATEAHSGQFRRDGVTPYIQHVYAVENRVFNYGLEYRAVALAHDLFENTTKTVQDLIDLGVPQNVIDAVVLLTKKDGVSYFDYIQAIKNNILAKIVKIADMLSNLADNPTERQIRKYAKGLLTLTDNNNYIIKNEHK